MSWEILHKSSVLSHTHMYFTYHMHILYTNALEHTKVHTCSSGLSPSLQKYVRSKNFVWRGELGDQNCGHVRCNLLLGGWEFGCVTSCQLRNRVTQNYVTHVISWGEPAVLELYPGNHHTAGLASHTHGQASWLSVCTQGAHTLLTPPCACRHVSAILTMYLTHTSLLLPACLPAV